MFAVRYSSDCLVSSTLERRLLQTFRCVLRSGSSHGLETGCVFKLFWLNLVGILLNELFQGHVCSHVVYSIFHVFDEQVDARPLFAQAFGVHDDVFAFVVGGEFEGRRHWLILGVALQHTLVAMGVLLVFHQTEGFVHQLLCARRVLRHVQHEALPVVTPVIQIEYVVDAVFPINGVFVIVRLVELMRLAVGKVFPKPSFCSAYRVIRWLYH